MATSVTRDRPMRRNHDHTSSIASGNRNVSHSYNGTTIHTTDTPTGFVHAAVFCLITALQIYIFYSELILVPCGKLQPAYRSLSEEFALGLVEVVSAMLRHYC